MHQLFLPLALPKRPPLPEGAQLLAADVGGTKTALAIFEICDGVLSIAKESVYPSKQFGSLAEAIRHLNGTAPLPARVSIAFAGPVQNGKATATNLDWSVDIAVLSKQLGIPEIFLLNDLEAGAYGLAALTQRDLITVYPGRTESGGDAESRPDFSGGNVGIIAPGTGLGEGGLFWDGSVLHPFATEGGHTGFTPCDKFDCELLFFLQTQYGRVSWERVVSGPGIHQIYNFLRDVKNREEPAGVREKMKNHDPAAAISSSAREGCAICMETLRLFTQYLAVEASNLALKIKATGGIFIGGGILPKIWNDDLRAVFLEHFFEVGRLHSLIETVPVHLVLNAKTALLGAAWYGCGQNLDS